jgi:diguanylate cyclase (GGDEF)-like protein
VRSPELERKVLVVDADAGMRLVAQKALGGAGMTVHGVADAEAGMRALASVEPHVLVLELEFPGKDGLWLLRRLRDEYMGMRPRVVVCARAEAIAGRISDLGVDALVLKPASPATLAAACQESGWLGERAREPEQLRELVRLSVLAGDLTQAFTTTAKRLALTFRMGECVMVATAGERQVLGCARGPVDESPEARIWDICQVALDAGSPVLVSGEEGRPQTHVAVPIESVGGTRLGVILLVDDGPRLLSPELCDALRALGQRLYGELAWRAVHDRIAADRDRLRESSMIDPLLGVWTRAALDQALPGEVSGSQRRGEPMTIAVMNLRGLRHINERYGHVVGDEALRHFAGITRRALRTQDLVARYAGDSLVVVLQGAGPADARTVIERIQNEIVTTPLEIGGSETKVPVQVTAGLAPLLGEDDSGEAAIARALWAVNAAKRRREAIVVAESADVGSTVAAGPSLEPGTTLGGMYQILHEISRGAMGVVYRAEDLGLGRPVALKTLRPDLARDRNFVERFRIEAATLAAIRHEHLVQVYAFGTDGEDVYFVMELVEGEPLEDRVEMARHEEQPLPLGLVAQTTLQIGDALEAMHKAGVLHRDVKPANILLDRERSRAVLVDVGIAKKRGTAHDPAGTPGFTAPESFIGGQEGPSSDAYSLAATAYTLLTATAPFGDGSLEQILGRQQSEGPTPPRQWRPDMPREVEDVLMRALDPVPARRFPSTTAFAKALARALERWSESAGVPTEIPHEQHTERREPAAAIARAPTYATPVAVSVVPPRPGATPVMGIPIVPDPTAAAPVAAAPPPPPSPPRPAAPPPPPAAAVTPAPPAPPPVVAAVDERQRGPSGPHKVVGGAGRRSGSHSVPPGVAPPRVMPMREPDTPPPEGVPHTRGVLFRSAYRVLGARQGAAWVMHVSRKHATLAQALQPQQTLLSWHPTELFLLMLRLVAESGRDARAFGRELGRVAASATFSRFFGADPAALNPGEVLQATDLVWKRYHTWGTVNVEKAGDHARVVTIADGPTDELVWSPAAGILEQVAVLAGATQAAVAVLSKDARVTGRCQFQISWMPPKAR